MLYLGMGILALIITSIVSFIFGDWSILFKLSGFIGIIALLISALMSGALISGDRVRANWTHEDHEDGKNRQERAFKLFLFGLPNLVGAIIYISIINKVIA
ncbi:DUF5316 domain-containing protein [Desulfosporosinus sp. BG]|uniref:DUF5316 domain-containing protein n=1 Tax=Desulfosporosinus sp. BG TaxID=1633135 RepID=UPI0008579735|nr:DUF5316 domain-containing protein [Desulfosporosinus sp. BG]ODA42367.1 hypothetical protein DSBG_0754 [Desulfosporosinus sp. BG]